MEKKVPIAVSFGNGIGPEIMQVTLKILDAAGANIEINKIEIGEDIYLQGNINGIDDSSWRIIQDVKVLLKAPTTTPRGSNFNSTTSALRSTLALYANIRPSISFSPFIPAKSPHTNLTVIKYNEETLNAHTEYQQTPNIAHSIRSMSKERCEKIIHYAFEYALANNRKKVTCFTRDSMLLTDGIFRYLFDIIAKEYPHIEHEYLDLETGCVSLVNTPEIFDCIVLPYLYANVLSNIAGGLAGSIGLLPSLSIGDTQALFETVHGSSPKKAFQNIANPSALILAAVNMLVHINQPETATLVNNAWLKTVEEGIHTQDIYHESSSKECVGTKEFADALIKRLGTGPSTLPITLFHKYTFKPLKSTILSIKRRELVGCDFYVYHRIDCEELVSILKACETPNLKLAEIKNQGVETFPKFHSEISCSEQWCCRFLSENGVVPRESIALLHQKLTEKLDVIKLENLYTLDDTPVYPV
ncbi:MAG: NADP-dependent isocitrate dehydrogenase [Chlamydiales bacterium]|nr:NADP-dependent isocitrate dehydrogenase [Chlamydiales bacterium]